MEQHGASERPGRTVSRYSVVFTSRSPRATQVQVTSSLLETKDPGQDPGVASIRMRETLHRETNSGETTEDMTGCFASQLQVVTA